MEKMNLWMVEHYLVNPTTREPGWSIDETWVKAMTRGEAIARVQDNVKDIGDIIQVTQCNNLPVGVATL